MVKVGTFTHIHDVIDGILQLLTIKVNQKMYIWFWESSYISEVAKAFDHPDVLNLTRRVSRSDRM